jgi:tryptophan-rich sensory protein
MFKAINLKKMFFSILIVNCIGAISIIIAGGAMGRMYDEIIRPDLSMPLNFFIAAWFVMFSMLGISLYFTQSASGGGDAKKIAARRFWLQMLFISVWKILFFNCNLFGFAAIWMLLSIVLIGMTIKKFRSISRGAGYLLIPHLLFCIYTLYLNYGTMMLN